MRTVGLGASGRSVPNEEILLKRIADLEDENAELKRKVDSLKKKPKSAAEKKDTEAGQVAESEKE